ncbi:hypothetical protein [Rhizorhabdus wittichii]|uniref:hypothetical protein n=1 Tax=Rhizorhabdus wittichii TaxID=160791 RepID=UPI0003603AA2|nr:hypothetical protein [Rhizorhabdus wittichii]
MSGQASRSDEKKRGRGRPFTYRAEFAGQAKKLCELGATDFELGEFFDVDIRTIYRWKHDHSEFAEALAVGKESLDERVERSLYQRAVGYSFDSEKVFHFQGLITRAPIVEHVPPDPGAAMLWLKNRRGDKWRDKQDHAHSGPDGGPIKTESTISLTDAPIEVLKYLASQVAK